MANETKTCSMTEAELYAVIGMHGRTLASVSNVEDMAYYIERINYLNKRLKAFNETEKPETETETKPTPAVAGWGAPTT